MSYIPTLDELNVIIGFVKSDIEREISWCKAWDSKDEKLISLDIVEGAGNYLAALGLLSYTEAFGRFLIRKDQNQEDKPQNGFNKFFTLMGQYYEDLLNQKPNIYNELRGSFAHEYSPNNILVAFFSDNPGVQFSRNIWAFNIEPYYIDLMKAVDDNFDNLHL